LANQNFSYMNVVGNFVSGLLSVLKITGGPMLYRYRYRNSAQGLHADWQNIGDDIQSVMGRLEEVDDGRRE
jgi:hypothetical protein